MKAEVIPYGDQYAVQIKQGVQYFRLDYLTNREECEWMAKMFNLALKAHDEAQRGKCMRTIEIEDTQIIDWLRDTTNLHSDRELIDNAITILQWAVEQRLQDRLVASLDARAKSYRELQMPALQEAAARARSKSTATRSA